MVGGATAVLDRRRVLAFAAVAALIGAYYAWPDVLPELSLWWDVSFLAVVLIPAVFLLVYLALPLRRARGLLPLGLAFGVLTWAFVEANLDVLANFSKLAATTALAFWFVTLFDTALWVALVALVVPWVDAYSSGAARPGTSSSTTERVHEHRVLVPRPGGHDAARLDRRISSSSLSISPPRQPSDCVCG